MLKVTTYLPVDYLGKIRDAIKDYCCSNSGKYTHCMSWHKVQSMWMPVGDAKPFQGTIGVDEYAEEYELTFRCKDEDIDEVVKLIKENHPYEDVSIDISILVA